VVGEVPVVEFEVFAAAPGVPAAVEVRRPRAARQREARGQAVQPVRVLLALGPVAGDSVTERWIGSCRRELLDRTLIWNQRHLMMVVREYEDFCNSHRPHRALYQAAPLRPLPDGITDLDHFRVRRHDRASGVIHEYRLVA
jgi:hypothetical protein